MLGCEKHTDIHVHALVRMGEYKFRVTFFKDVKEKWWAVKLDNFNGREVFHALYFGFIEDVSEWLEEEMKLFF